MGFMAWNRRAVVVGTFASLALAGLVVGCSAASKQSGPPPNDAPAVDALVNPAHPGLESCRGSAASTEVEDDLQMAADFKESCHEMVVCGGLNASLTTSLIGVFIDAAAGKNSGGPSGFVFDGKGTWAAGTRMDVDLHLGADTSFGKKGDLIVFNVFDVSTYFTGAQIKATASVNTKGETTTSLGMSFTGLGPGIELLGLGPSPQSPLVIDSDKIGAALGAMQLHARVHMNDTHGDSRIVYELEMPMTTVGAMASGAPTPMNLLDVHGTRGNGQVLTVTDFGIAYRDIGAGYLEGSIAFEVTGGASFAYGATFTYPRRSAPDVALSCETGKKAAFDAGSSDAGTGG